MQKTATIASILLVLISVSCGVSKKMQTEATPESVNEEVNNNSKVHYYNNPATNFHSFGGRFIAFGSNGYVNMQNEPSVNSSMMTTIPNYTIVHEYFSSEDKNWLVVGYYDYAAQEMWYGYVHKSGLVEIPYNYVRDEFNIVRRGYYVRGLDYLFLVRHITLESVGLEEDYTLQVFFINSMDLAFVWEDGKSNPRPIPVSLSSIKEFFRESDYKEAGYDFDENRPQIYRCFFVVDPAREGFYAFDEQIQTNNGQVEPVSVISKAASYDDKFNKRVDFVIKNDVVLFEGVIMISFQEVFFP